MKRNIELLCGCLSQVHLGKDLFLVPYYLGQIMDYDVRIVYARSEAEESLPDIYKGVRLFPVELKGGPGSWFLYREWNFILYLLKCARKIDVLVRFHLTLTTALMILLYKLLNPQGKVYVKLDGYVHALFHTKKKNRIQYLKYRIMQEAVRKTTLFTCETTQMYSYFMESSGLRLFIEGKLVLLTNGFDEEELREAHFQERSYESKENVMITVGRLGTNQKNTEMLLKALAEINLGSWKVYLIGPAEPEFKFYMNNFFQQYPEKIGHIVFTGAIYDKKILWDYYDRAKVFLLTSRFESYALVLNEAKRFRNYIISTDVGAASELIEFGRYGLLVEQEDHKMLACKCQEIIDGCLDVNMYTDFETDSLAWEKQILDSRICELLG